MEKYIVVYPYDGISLAIERNEVVIHVLTRMDLENLISERGQSQGNTRHMIPLK